MKKLFITFCLAMSVLSLRAQELALSTNFADYAELGTLNLEASYGVARNWSVSAGAKYNPFTYKIKGNAVQSRQRSFSAGVRYWPWHIFSGWWFSAQVKYQEYNRGGISSPVTFEGDRFGAVLGTGYSYMLAPYLNLELGLALWSGYDIYTRYACQSCGKKTGEGGKYFILPSDILLGLTFIF